SPKNSVVVNFQVKTNKKQREPVWDYFCGKEFSQTGGSSFCLYKGTNEDFTFFDVFDIISDARFVVSPPGAAIDCYRTYETLLLGSYPIVQTSQLDGLFQDLPVLIVENYTMVTGPLLDKVYNKFRNRDWNFEKLYHTYWQDVIWTKRQMLGGPSYFLYYNYTKAPELEDM
ncbi:hypothetical protein HDV01_003704, partial [Terramyces sp. JEL0728]